MNKYIKSIVAALSILAISGTFAGCGSKATSSSGGDSKKEIVVWTKFTNEGEVKAIDKAAQEWANKNGKKVKVVADKGENQAFIQAANSSSGPDIVYGIPHDNLGTFKKAKLLAEIPADLFDKSKFNPKGIEGVSYDNKMYGVPLSVESAILFYNADKVKEAPKTFEELREQAKTLGFKYDINNIYFSYAFIGAEGGYVFKNNNGVLDPKDIGLGNEGAKKAYQLMQDLVQKDKLLAADIKGDMAKGEFQNGKTAFYIGGPWDVQGFKDSKVNFKTAPYPTLEGKQMPSFVGVQAAFINAKSKKQKDDFELLKYLVENTSQSLFKVGNRIPALTVEAEKPEVISDPVIQAIKTQVSYGIPMPNITEMQPVWKINDSMSLLTSGKITADKYAEKVLNDIKQGIQQQQ